ncbi:outer membrane protein TolC [Parabacteroides sp. PF5-5]|nr:outer membrane protein TolC [Parabacteroides sp. PF5-13]MDH6327897.1 outer membrane protein TolC [Parabacteroides sp. PH5-41]MDH6335587.1 outer membrane protein TolC [Parabacteroides sp. PF5-5]MDH6346761.1 outer membrane protein TolC [Parabacteroides sp. PH5-46]MDH6361613.1 outer membrane protein TolC [Parabacteroides sp. PH5-16]MDH6377280.1 outer membrane protein TolC [Parabacteroides sp. PH5-33]
MLKMKKIILFICLLLTIAAVAYAEEEENIIRLGLKEAIGIAQLQSVDAAVALNELKTAYWEYRTHQAEQLPEVNFIGTLPSYNNNYGRYQESDGSYKYVQNNWLGISGEISIDQNVPLTGGKLSLNTSLDFTRQLGGTVYNEFMSIPVGITFTQPIFGVNDQKWKRRIEPLRYKEAKAAYIESVEGVTISTISYFFSLLYAKENLAIANQNLENANKLYEIAIAKREIGHISESELMQLNLSALQAKGLVTEAQSNLNARMFQLRAFLGLSEQDVIEPVLPELAPSLRMQYQTVLEKAQENNSFAKNIMRQQLEADYAVATAKGNQRNISLYASVGYTGKDRTFNKAYDHLKGNQIVEVGVRIPLLDWGKRKGQVKVAESNREVILSKTRQEQMNFNQDIFLLVERFNNQAAQLEIAEQADVIAEKRYKTSIETFLIGKINILDLNDAQKSKDETKLKHIDELHKYWNYFYNIRSVTLYDFISDTTLDAEFEEIIRGRR